MRVLAFVLVFVALVLPSKASAVPPVDPKLTYRLTVYDRDPSKLVPDGTRVVVVSMPPRATVCAEAEVTGGIAEIHVEVTEVCPAGMTVYFALLNLPAGGVTAYADPAIE